MQFDSRKRTWLYLLLTFVITYAFEFIVIVPMAADPEKASAMTGLMSAAMLIPALGMLLTRLISKEGFRDSWIKPNLKGNVAKYLLAWFISPVLVLLGAVAYFLIFPEQFDYNMSGMGAQLAAALGQEVEGEVLRSFIISQFISGIFVAPLVNGIFCLGEELGWRAYLLPKLMERFKVVPAVLISGVIWGLWHAPLTSIGHNYGTGYAGFPFTGILAMCCFCVVIGTLMSYLTLKTRSCIPAVIIHGSLNGLTATSVYFLKDPLSTNPFVGPAATGVIGGLGFILAMAVIIVLMIRDEKKGTLVAPYRLSKAERAQSDDNAAMRRATALNVLEAERADDNQQDA